VVIEKVGHADEGVEVLEEKCAIVNVEEVEEGEGKAGGVGVLTKKGTSGCLVWIGLSEFRGGEISGNPLGFERFGECLHEEEEENGGHIVSLLHPDGVWDAAFLFSDLELDGDVSVKGANDGDKRRRGAVVR
jgi:hypothetical protein